MLTNTQRFICKCGRQVFIILAASGIWWQLQQSLSVVAKNPHLFSRLWLPTWEHKTPHSFRHLWVPYVHKKMLQRHPDQPRSDSPHLYFILFATIFPEWPQVHGSPNQSLVLGLSAFPHPQKHPSKLSIQIQTAAWPIPCFPGCPEFALNLKVDILATSLPSESSCSSFVFERTSLSLLPCTF